LKLEEVGGNQIRRGYIGDPQKQHCKRRRLTVVLYTMRSSSGYVDGRLKVWDTGLTRY